MKQGNIVRHKKKGKIYEIDSIGLVQINREWVPSINYHQVHLLLTGLHGLIVVESDDRIQYTREATDFFEKFEIVYE